MRCFRREIAAGKGWGNFDVQTTLAGNLPTGDTAALGRQLVSNTAFQYVVFGKFWPELEVNSTSYLVGKNSGETQVFLTPGLGFGRIRIWRALKFSTAAGMQTAATRFHTYNPARFSRCDILSDCRQALIIPGCPRSTMAAGQKSDVSVFSCPRNSVSCLQPGGASWSWT